MKRYLALVILAVLLPVTAHAQQASILPPITPGDTLLTVSAEGKSTRTPELAMFSAGVTSSGKTAGEALSANALSMNGVIGALKRAGIADRDIQTSNLSLSPVYAPPHRLPDGQYEPAEQRIIGYQVTNTVSVRQRKLDQFGRVLDTLVAAGANQISGPAFMMDDAEAANDEARIDAMKKARARADLFARAAGLRVARIISISESGGGGYQPPVMYARMAKADMAAAPTPVAAGELQMNAGITVLFELAP